MCYTHVPCSPSKAEGGPWTSPSLLSPLAFPRAYFFPLSLLFSSSRSAALHHVLSKVSCSVSQVPQTSLGPWEAGVHGTAHDAFPAFCLRPSTVTHSPITLSTACSWATRHGIIYSDKLPLLGRGPRVSLARVWAPEPRHVGRGPRAPWGIFSDCAGCHGPTSGSLDRSS